MGSIAINELKPGEQYRIVFDDCCIRGEMPRATFVLGTPYDDGSGDEWSVLYFDCVTLSTFNGCEFYPCSV
jgi:hypothetical protein